MSTANRLLAILGLFTLERPKWTVDAAAQALGMTASTAYRYFKSLVDAGLVAADTPRHYTLGPAVIEYDRQLRLRDPLIATAAPVMRGLAETIGPDVMVLLCRLYRRRVLCVHQELIGRSDFHAHWEHDQPIIYQRGQPMPLHRGAPSKAILAHIRARQLRAIYADESAAWRESGLGDTWPEVKRTLRLLRNQSVITTRGEISSGTEGIAVPIITDQTGVIGSLSMIVPPDRLTIPRHQVGQMLAAAAHAIEAGLARDGEDDLNGSQAPQKVLQNDIG